MIARLKCVSGVLVISATVTLAAQQMPQIGGETLAGHKVALPQAVAGKVVVFVVGFSKASKTSTSTWGKKINGDFGSRPGFECYQLAVLEEVPRLVRGLVISSIKGDVPENLRDHFVPVLHGESELKRLVKYNEKDDAYLVLVDGAGSVRYQIHGAVTDANYSQFWQHIDSLLLETRR